MTRVLLYIIYMESIYNILCGYMVSLLMSTVNKLKKNCPNEVSRFEIRGDSTG